MWASPGGRNNNYGSSNNNNKSRTSKSSSPSSPIPNPSSAKINSMEEVWRDISGLASLSTENPLITTKTKTNKNQSYYNCFPSTALIVEDFLARPFNKDPTTTTTTELPSSAQPTILGLGSISGSDHHFHYLESRNPVNPQVKSSHGNVIITPSSSLLPSFCKKRAQKSNDYSDDRRQKRMIKNRESAARSRARKQAYTNELEMEVANLLEENASLRRQQEKFLQAHAQLIHKKHTLYRTSTAPF